MSRPRLSPALLGLSFVATEVLAWFIALRVLVSIAEDSFLTELAARLADTAGAGGVAASEVTIAGALGLVRAAVGTPHGPSLALVLGIGLGAFVLARWLAAARLGVTLSAIVVVATTILVLNLCAHLVIAHDWRVWETAHVIDFFADPSPYFADRLDLAAFVARPDVEHGHGAALSITLFGLAAVWLRFLLGGRVAVTVERVTRSFGAGFLVSLVSLAVASVFTLRGLGPWVVAQFACGMLALSIANHARAVPAEEGARRLGPWVSSVIGSIGVLLAVALAVIVADEMRAGVALAMLGDLAGRILLLIIVVVLTPFALVMDFVLHLVFGPQANIFDNMGRVGVNFDALRETDEARESIVPGWLGNGLRFLAIGVFVVGGYLLARLVIGRRPPPADATPEVRSGASAGGGLRAVLRDALLRRGGDPHAWAARHAVYRLFRRAEEDGEERALRRMPGETPLEWAMRARALMEAPFVPLAATFDRLRYGRHEPSAAEVDRLARALAAWEREVPATDALRERIAGPKPLDEATDMALRVETGRRVVRGKPAPGTERPLPPPDAPL